MLGILSETLKIATRADTIPNHQSELLNHEKRKRAELRRQLAHQRRYRQW